MEETTIPTSELKKNIKTKNNWNTLTILILSLFVFVSGFFVGYTKKPSATKISNVINAQNDSPQTNADFEAFWKVWRLLDEKYPDAKNISSQERVWGAIKGLLSSTNDPYSTFFTPEESKQFNEEISGSFSGIGVEIGQKDGLLTVISPLKNSPAEKAGIKSGDAIFKVDGKLVTDMTIDQTIKLIRGEKGTSVILSVYRENVSDPIEISVVRDIIEIPTMDEKILDQNTYMISLYNFNATSADLMHKAFLDFTASNKKNLIIDLRGNPGGYLESAISISSELLPKGDIIVTEDYGLSKKQLSHRSKGFDTVSSDKKIVVLIDGGSASASEIVAGALQDNGRATLIGTKSYGKGSVQELMPVTADTSVKITIAKWLTPKGTSISEKGIVPDIQVSEKSAKKDDITDPVVKRAIEWLVNKK